MTDDLRDRIAQAFADARKAWPTSDGSPVFELFVADAVLAVLAPQQGAEMTTYRHADGSTIGDDWTFACDIETCEMEAEYAEEPIEFVEERWVRVSERRFWLPLCNETGCEEKATHWGLCEAHAREDDPAAFGATEEADHG